MLNKAAIGLQMLSLMTLLGCLLLPEAVVGYAALVAVLILWIPIGRLVPGAASTGLRGLLILAAVGTFFAGAALNAVPAASGDSGSIALSLIFAWLLCILLVPDTAAFTFPVSLLACFETAVLVINEVPGRVWVLAVAVPLLVASGALFFIVGLRHPTTGSARLSRPAVWRFSPHLVVVIVSVSVMLLTVDWLRGHVGWLARYLPDPGSESRVCTLVRSAPKFRGDVICEVRALRGPLPAYLGDMAYCEYMNGMWSGGENCGTLKHYGYKGRLFKDRLPRGECLVVGHAVSGHKLAPFAAVRRPGAQPKKQADDGTSATLASYHWDTKPGSGTEGNVKIPPGADGLTGLPRVQRLARRICAGASDDPTRAMLINRYLQQRFYYDMSRSFNVRDDADPVEYFLFSAK